MVKRKEKRGKGSSKQIVKKGFPHFHRERRKRKSEGLTGYKKLVHNYNEKHLKWLENFVQNAIIVALILLVFIILINESRWLYDHVIKWDFLISLDNLKSTYQNEMVFIDDAIIILFTLDLYFQYFKRRSTAEFLKTYFIDILAILPLASLSEGLRSITAFREGQALTHVVVEGERVTEAIAREEELVKLTRMERLEKIFPRIARLLRLFRVTHIKRKNKAEKPSLGIKPPKGY